MNAEMQAFLTEMKTELLTALRTEFAPMVEDVAKAAVAASGNPIAEAVGPPVIDAIDALIMDLTGQVPPKNAVAAPDDTESRLQHLERHVAALTVTTGNATSAGLQSVKASATARDAAISGATEA